VVLCLKPPATAGRGGVRKKKHERKQGFGGRKEEGLLPFVFL